MILRRLADSIRNQDWFVAVIEILIVVIGIFLGLQVDDWNQQRKDRADEAEFMQRLHGDLELANDMSARVRDRRLSRHSELLEAVDVLFGHSERKTLNDADCTAIGSSAFFNMAVSGLSSVEELAATGRMDIVDNKQLRTALIELKQASDTLIQMMNLQTSQNAFRNLPSHFPELMTMQSYFDGKEIRARFVCDQAGMQASQSFMNHFAVNADGYDAFVRDALLPWLEKHDDVHHMVDEILGVSHPERE